MPVPPSEKGDKGMPDLSNVMPDSTKVKQVWDKIKRGQKRKHTFSKEWPRFYNLYAGKHWDKARPEWMSEPVINLTFSTIETILPILTDNRPQISVVPFEPDDIQIATVISEIVKANWEYNDMDIKLPKLVKNCLIFGNGFLKVDWDPSGHSGQGDVRMSVIDPANVIVDPYGVDDETIQWIAHVQNVPKNLIEANPEWAPKASQIKSGTFDPTFTINRSVASQGSRQAVDAQYMDTQGKQAWNFVSDGTPERSDEDLVTLVELWSRDLETGGVRKTVIANDTLLEDGESPFKHNKFPIVHFVDYAMGWDYWASGEVQHVEKLQLEINKRRGMMIDILKFTSMPMMVVDPTSGVDYENLVSRPGLVIPAIGGTGAVGWMHPPRIPGELFAMNQADKADFDTILGNVDVLQGKRPVGIEAAAAIEALTEAANTRMRLKVRYLEAALRQVGRLVVSLIQQFYGTGRVVRVTGRDGEILLDEALDFIEIGSGTPLGSDGTVGFENVIPEDAEFDIRIGAGSTLPVSRQSRFSQALQLFQIGAIDQVELLKHSGWPRYEEVIARMQQGQMGPMGPSPAG